MSESETASEQRMASDNLKLWLEERRANCINIARMKREKRDRESWLEDACYFHAAIQAVDDLSKSRDELAKDTVTVPRGLTFGAFRSANVARCIKWHPAGIDSWSPI